MGLVGLFGLLPRCLQTRLKFLFRCFDMRFEFSEIWRRGWGLWVCLVCFRAVLKRGLNFQGYGFGDGACGSVWVASALL